ncbi:hypothetical protein, partial [Butyricicoccus pullicaecorum]|uniref:hypothetical protein n=1 Tax=Butyricicoccus pullicaecorum TaxID=501571 RepID=UPI003990C0BC
MYDPGFNLNKQKEKTNHLVGLFKVLRITLLLLTHGVRTRIVAYGLWDALSFLFWLIPVFDRNQKGVSPSADGDQVPPGRARLRAWTAPGLRPGPVYRPLVLFALGARTRIVTYGLWAGF